MSLNMEEDDEVVETIPVFLNKSLADNIHVLQYPVLNHTINLGNSHVVNSLLKPNTQQLKIEFALNTDSQNYDAFKGDQLGIAADGKQDSRSKAASKERPTFKSGRMDKQSYVSSVSGQNVDRFVVGLLKEGELHLTPVNQIYQMRPSFTYFDKQDKRAKAEKKDDESAAEEEIKPVTVKFAKNENEKTRKTREKSFNFISQMKNEEPWCETAWYPADSDFSAIEKQKLTLSANEKRHDFLNLCKDVYVKCLVSSTDDVTETTQPKFEELILAELRTSKVVPLSTILQKLQTKSTDKILPNLQGVGTMIRGNWVLKSELVYPEKSISYTNGVTSTFMVRAREFVLYKFSVQDSLDRQFVTQCTQLPTEEAKEVLESVAHYEAGTGWVMLVPPNDELEMKFPEVVQRRKAYWDGKLPEFHELEKNRLYKPTRKRSHRDSK